MTSAPRPDASTQRTPAPGPVGDLFAYSSAVRVGSHVWVSGAAPYDREGQLVGPNDPYEQTRQALANLTDALGGVGAKIDHVVATRIYVLDIQAWRDVGRAHGETFNDIRPATTLVEVRALLGPGMHVEIEAQAEITAVTNDEGAPATSASQAPSR